MEPVFYDQPMPFKTYCVSSFNVGTSSMKYVFPLRKLICYVFAGDLTSEFAVSCSGKGWGGVGESRLARPFVPSQHSQQDTRSFVCA